MIRITTLKNLTISITILSFFSYPILLPPNNQFIQQTNKQQQNKSPPLGSQPAYSSSLLSLLSSPPPNNDPFQPKNSLLTFPPFLPEISKDRTNEKKKVKVKVSVYLGTYLQVDWAAY